MPRTNVLEIETALAKVNAALANAGSDWTYSVERRNDLFCVDLYAGKRCIGIVASGKSFEPLMDKVYRVAFKALADAVTDLKEAHRRERQEAKA